MTLDFLTTCDLAVAGGLAICDKGGAMLGHIRTIALVVIAIIVTAFILQNFATTEVAFF